MTSVEAHRAPLLRGRSRELGRTQRRRTFPTMAMASSVVMIVVYPIFSRLAVGTWVARRKMSGAVRYVGRGRSIGNRFLPQTGRLVLVDQHFRLLAASHRHPPFSLPQAQLAQTCQLFLQLQGRRLRRGVRQYRRRVRVSLAVIVQAQEDMHVVRSQRSLPTGDRIGRRDAISGLALAAVLQLFRRRPVSHARPRGTGRADAHLAGLSYGCNHSTALLRLLGHRKLLIGLFHFHRNVPHQSRETLLSGRVLLQDAVDQLGSGFPQRPPPARKRDRRTLESRSS